MTENTGKKNVKKALQVQNAIIKSTDVNKVITQKELADIISNKDPKRYQFIKNQPIPLLKYDGDVNKIPKEVIGKLGSVDQTGYSEEILKESSFIVLQMDGDKTDFYPLGRDAEANYNLTSSQELSKNNPKLMNKLNKVESVNGLFKQENPQIIGGLKTKPVTMVKMSEMGYNKENKVEIESPWGDTQTKPVGQDAFIVIEPNGQYYMVNVDKDRLPIGYIEAPNRDKEVKNKRPNGPEFEF